MTSDLALLGLIYHHMYDRGGSAPRTKQVQLIHGLQGSLQIQPTGHFLITPIHGSRSKTRKMIMPKCNLLCKIIVQSNRSKSFMASRAPYKHKLLVIFS